MAELDRVLDVLLHDLRSPLSVASGYVRLLRQERLDSFEARDKAWSHTATALTRIAHLCDEAVGFLQSQEGVRRPMAPATLVTRVRQRCHESGLVFESDVALDRPALSADPVLHATTDVDHLADAVLTLASLHLGNERPARIRAVLADDSRELQFRIPLTAASDPPTDTPFDPWQQPGLAAALACHIVSRASGHVRSGHELVITFPLQESQS